MKTRKENRTEIPAIRQPFPLPNGPVRPQIQGGPPPGIELESNQGGRRP